MAGRTRENDGEAQARLLFALQKSSDSGDWESSHTVLLQLLDISQHSDSSEGEQTPVAELLSAVDNMMDRLEQQLENPSLPISSDGRASQLKLMFLVLETNQIPSQEAHIVRIVRMGSKILRKACNRAVQTPSGAQDHEEVVMGNALKTIERASSKLRRVETKEAQGAIGAVCGSLALRDSSEGYRFVPHDAASVAARLFESPHRYVFTSALLKVMTEGSEMESRGAIMLVTDQVWGECSFDPSKAGKSLATILPVQAVLACFHTLISTRTISLLPDIGLSICRLLSRRGSDLLAEWDDLLWLFQTAIQLTPDVDDIWIEATKQLTALYLGISLETLNQSESSESINPSTLLDQFGRDRGPSSLLAPLEETADVLDLYKKFLTERATIRLLESRASRALPWLGEGTWIDNLQRIVLTYYTNESRQSVRAAALQVLREHIWTYSGLYENKVVEEVLLQAINSDTGRTDDENDSFSDDDAIELVADVCEHLHLSDDNYSKLLQELTRYSESTAYAMRVCQRTIKLFFDQVLHGPAQQALEAFEVVLKRYLHHSETQVTVLSLKSLRKVTADGSYHITIRKTELLRSSEYSQSKLFVSYDGRRRRPHRGDTSTPPVLLPIQLLLNEVVAIITAESKADILVAAFELLLHILKNPYMTRGCDIERLAGQLLNDIHSRLSTASWVDLEVTRKLSFDVFHLLLGYRVPHRLTDSTWQQVVIHLNSSLRKELTYDEPVHVAQLARSLATAFLLQPDLVGDMAGTVVFLLNHVDNMSRDAAFAVLEAVRGVGDSEVLTKLAKTEPDFVSIAVHALPVVLSRSDFEDGEDAVRWGRLCFCAYASLVAVLEDKHIQEVLSELERLPRSVLISSCIEYTICFLRSTLTTLRATQNDSAQSGHADSAWIINRRHPVLVTVRTVPDGTSEVIQRRVTGTARYLVFASQGPERGFALNRQGLLKSDASGKNSVSADQDRPGLVLSQLGFGAHEANTVNLKDVARIDRAPTEDIHKIGLFFVGEFCSTQEEILSNTSGSPSYNKFVRSLGRFYNLNNLPPGLFRGGLDSKNDGDYCVHWSDRTTQIMFLASTLMPNQKDQDGEVVLTKKIGHIGNCWVNIVWVDRGDDYDFEAIAGFNGVHLYIFPSGWDLFRVEIKVLKAGLRPFGPLQPSANMVTGDALAAIVRQTALNADAVCSMYPPAWATRHEILEKIARNTKGQPQRSKHVDQGFPVI